VPSVTQSLIGQSRPEWLYKSLFMYMHTGMDEIDPNLFRSQCVLTKSRRAARSVSRHFAQLIKPHGVTPSQASLLFALYGSEATSVSELADGIGIERSALTRNLRLLEKAGHVDAQVGGRGGAKAYRLSQTGHATLMEMVPLWHEAQHALREKLGEGQWKQMQATLALLADL